MEIKKSSKADLEHLRIQGFLLGLVVVLASLFVVFEYSIIPDDPLDDPDLLEQFQNDSELSSLMRPENELALAPKAEPDPTVKLKIVEDDTPQDVRQQEEPVETDVDSDMNESLEEEEPEKPEEKDSPMQTRVVEDLPQFPGGPMEFLKWLTRNLKYPQSARVLKVQGRVVTEFIVNTDGSVTDIKIVKPLHADCDREALRVLRMMPRWTPGVQNDQPCRTKVCIPIVFSL